jgi:hypothetical protein
MYFGWEKPCFSKEPTLQEESIAWFATPHQTKPFAKPPLKTMTLF